MPLLAFRHSQFLSPSNCPIDHDRPLFQMVGRLICRFTDAITTNFNTFCPVPQIARKFPQTFGSAPRTFPWRPAKVRSKARNFLRQPTKLPAAPGILRSALKTFQNARPESEAARPGVFRRTIYKIMRALPFTIPVFLPFRFCHLPG